MAAQDARATLDRLIRDRGEDYSSLSRMLGRNPAYIQQYIKRGVPKKLDEDDRRTLARYFDVAERLLGGPEREDARIINVTGSGGGKKLVPELMLVPYFNVEASAGPGAVPINDQAEARLAFRTDWLRELSAGSPSAMSIIRVTGDSMMPTLADGDDILVDGSDGADRLRDGIYVLRVDDMLNVKRLAMNPNGGGFEIRSDNPAYPVWRVGDVEGLTIIGRVVWAGRRVI